MKRKKGLSSYLLMFVLALCSFALNASAQQQVKELKLAECMRLQLGSASIISDDHSLWSAVRNDASREDCIVKVQEMNIDLAKSFLVGANINSGYCRKPKGLLSEVVNDPAQMTTTVKISYIDPQGGVCAALSNYVYWILVPKPPQGYTIKLDIGPSANNLENPRKEEQ